jgi:hypothetical protein
MLFASDIPIGKTVRLIYSWLDSKDMHKIRLKSAYCYFHYKALIGFSNYISGSFEILNISTKKCSICVSEGD